MNEENTYFDRYLNPAPMYINHVFCSVLFTSQALYLYRTNLGVGKSQENRKSGTNLEESDELYIMQRSNLFSGQTAEAISRERREQKVGKNGNTKLFWDRSILIGYQIANLTNLWCGGRALIGMELNYKLFYLKNEVF